MIAALALAAVMTSGAQGQAPARDARPAPALGTATVTGIVVSADPQPRPLRRARVTINGTALVPGRTAITADDGTFAFAGLRAGRYVLTAAKDGYATMTPGRPGQPSARVAVAEGETQQVTVRVPRGAVITGVVLDADGQPAQGIAVTALIHRYIGTQGERRYMAAGSPNILSDDRGVYRIYGLPAGEYVVAAQPQTRQVGLGLAEVRTVSRGVVSDKSLILSQVFHPAATEVGRATRVTVRAGEERSGIDVQLQYVPLATISGIASVGSGWNPASLTMVRTDGAPGFEPIRSARADADGRFTLNSVPPGQYRIFARSTQASPITTSGSPLIVTPGNMQVAFADVTVAGEDITSVSFSLQAAFAISGRIAFEGNRPPPLLAELRVFVPMTLAIANTGLVVPQVRLESAGTFKVEGIVPGLYRAFENIQGIRAPVGAWWLKSLVLGGREALDSPLDLRQNVDDAVATFADQASELTGTIKDAQGNPAIDHFIVAFSTDRSTWFFNSRRVAGLRPDAQGRYSIRNLPPGEYRLVMIADIEQGEWFDPAVLERLLPSAAAITITGVEKKTHDLVIR